MGYCADYQTLQERLKDLDNIIPVENIKIHPENKGENLEDAKASYGIKVLGSYIGTILEKIQKDFVINILGCSRHQFSDLNFQQCLFSVSDGGLGFHKFSEIAPAAYVTSVISWLTHEDNKGFLETIKNNFPQVQHQPHFEEFFSNIGIFDIDEKLRELVDKDDDISDPFIRMDAIARIRDGRKQTVQNILAYSLANKRREQFMSKLSVNRRHLQIFTSLQNDHGNAWLDARPTEEDTYISDFTFQTSLRLRLYMPIPTVVNNKNGKYCSCKTNKAMMQG